MTFQFHVLRRQLLRDFRKPVCIIKEFLQFLELTTAQLIVFWSKALLRHPHARSSLEEMTAGTAFQRYIPDPHPDNLVPPNEIRRHILCTGLYSQLGGTAINF